MNACPLDQRRVEGGDVFPLVCVWTLDEGVGRLPYLACGLSKPRLKQTSLPSCFRLLSCSDHVVCPTPMLEQLHASFKPRPDYSLEGGGVSHLHH